MTLPLFTLIHILISIAALGSGFIVLGGMLASAPLPRSTFGTSGVMTLGRVNS